MKKFFALILSFLYFFSANAAFAFSELYYLKNAEQKVIAQQIEASLIAKKYELKKKNPFFAIPINKPQESVIIVLQQSGKNLFYYFESADDGKKLNKQILNSFKDQNIVYEESINEMHLNNFSKIAKKVFTGEEKTYSFEETKPAVNQSQKQTMKPLQPTTLKGFVGKVAKGSTMNVYLQTAINTATATQGDQVIGILQTDWTTNNMVIAPQGSILYGTLTKANHASIGLRNGSVEISFNNLVTPNGKTYNLTTKKIDFKVTNEGKAQKTAQDLIVKALVGGLIGIGIALLCSSNSSGSKNIGQGAAIGAGAMAAVGLVGAVAEKGIDAEIPSFTEMEVSLEQPIDVVLSY